MAAPALPLLQDFARGSRGAAGIELGFGSVALLSIAMLCFDLYSLVGVNSASERSAVAMADYVSREPAPHGDQLTALGQFLHRSEFAAPVGVVYVISAVRRPPGDDPAEVLWVDDKIRFGADTTTDALATNCSSRGQSGWRASLLRDPALSGMAEREVTIVAEVCARPVREGMLTGLLLGDIYQLHVLPFRDTEQAPAQPERPASAGDGGSDGGNSGSAGMARPLAGTAVS